jgi:type I restriction enzyme M protein
MNKDELKWLEANLWRAADNLRANSDLKASEYATPVLGLIFLKFADNTYRRHEAEINNEYDRVKGKRNERSKAEISIARCGFYLPDEARYKQLLDLPDEADIVAAVKAAMEAVEKHKDELSGILPKDEYNRFQGNRANILKDLLRIFANIPLDTTGDVFGQIYQYFLGEFARTEGQKGGEFFTPASVVKLMVEIIEPHEGRVLDPACGSGGMFVQVNRYIHAHGAANAGAKGIYVCGMEKTMETVRLAQMNCFVNGIPGEIKQANTYYEDPFTSVEAFDYVLANPPFNVNDVSLNTVEKDARFNTYGIPRNKGKAKKANAGKETVPNANYLWINLFATSLKPAGRAALVMANSASDARHSEADIRRTLIEHNLIYAMVTLPSNMFYTVTLPATLWFFDRAKPDDTILFIDARNNFTQIDRAHREFSDEQIQNIAVISHLHKGRRDAFVRLVDRYFKDGIAQLTESHTDVAPLCAQIAEVLAGEDATSEARVAAEAVVAAFTQQWSGLADLQQRNAAYEATHAAALDVDARNAAQRELQAAFTPFFAGMHEALKHLDKTVRQHEKAQAEKLEASGKRATTDRKTRKLKEALEALHGKVKDAELFYQHISWLQTRFPNAAYEDVTGLCKRATPAEVQEQEYSLNPGRYVGVVIEEDGKTEEEFIEEIAALNDELSSLTQHTQRISKTIFMNIEALTA